MYVVRRSFRNYGQMMVPGSVVEPGSIKRFKSRLNDGRIVEVTEQNFDKWDEYFKVRIGVAIQLHDEGAPDEGAPDEGRPDDTKHDDAKPVQVVPVQAKVVVKPVSK